MYPQPGGRSIWRFISQSKFGAFSRRRPPRSAKTRHEYRAKSPLTYCFAWHFDKQAKPPLGSAAPADSRRPKVVEQSHPPRFGPWRRLWIKPNGFEYLFDYVRLFDHGDELQLAAALALLNVDIEHALEQPRPRHAHRCAVCVLAVALARCGLLRRRWHDLRPQLRVRRQHAVKPYQVQSRSGYQCGQPLHEFHREIQTVFSKHPPVNESR